MHAHAGPSKVIFADEISTGLDSSTTFQIVHSFSHFAHKRKVRCGAHWPRRACGCSAAMRLCASLFVEMLFGGSRPRCLTPNAAAAQATILMALLQPAPEVYK